jgi:hypothetical protein
VGDDDVWSNPIDRLGKLAPDGLPAVGVIQICGSIPDEHRRQVARQQT